MNPETEELDMIELQNETSAVENPVEDDLLP